MGRRTWVALGIIAAAGLAIWIADSGIRVSEARRATEERRQEAARTDRDEQSRQEVDIAVNEETSPREILRLVDRQWQQVRDYRCTITSSNQLDSGLQSNTLEVAFKRPGMCRHQIVEGRSQGTLLTVNAQGRVQARPGGVLGVLVVEMSRDDPRLRDGRGIPFYQSDWGSEIDRWLEAADSGASLRRLSDSESDGVRCWVLEWRVGNDQDVHQLWIDQETRLPARIRSLRHEQLLRDARYSNLVLNTDPPDSYFNLK